MPKRIPHKDEAITGIENTEEYLESVIVQMMLHKLLLPMDWQIHRVMAWICQSKPSIMQYHLNQYRYRVLKPGCICRTMGQRNVGWGLIFAVTDWKTKRNAYYEESQD